MLENKELNLKVLIADDERLARELIKYLLKNAPSQYNFVFHIEEADNAVIAQEKIELFKPQLLFLDIEMPGMPNNSVTDFIEKLTYLDFILVFQTAHRQYAAEAFDLNAQDYLVKPFTNERFYETLERVREEFLAKQNNSQAYNKFLTVKIGQSLQQIELSDIMYFFSKEHHTYIHTKNDKEYIYDKPLKMLESTLLIHNFIRIHNNCICNMTFVKKSFQEEGIYYLVLQKEKKLEVSINKKKSVVNYLLKKEP